MVSRGRRPSDIIAFRAVSGIEGRRREEGVTIEILDGEIDEEEDGARLESGVSDDNSGL